MNEPDDGPRLSHTRLLELRRTLTTHIEVDVPADGETGYPPGAVDYYATFNVDWHRADSGPRPVDRDFEIMALLAHRQGLDPNGEVVTLAVGSAHLVVVDVYEPELWDALDARDADLHTLATALLLPGGRSNAEFGSVLLPDVVERIELIGSHGLLINTLDVHAAFRGGQVGLHAVGAALAELRRGCSFAALYAMRPGLHEHEARDASHERLAEYWGRLGFTPLVGETMLLSLAHVTFDDDLAALRS